MNRRGRILLPFLFILTCLPALSATAPNVKSVQHIYDAQILTAIKASGQIVKLRKTRLKDIAPQFWVEAAPKLSWTEALQVASLRFKDNPTKRVLFLAAYLKKDDPASRISEMQIQVPIAKELFTNNYSDPYELKEKPAVGKSPTSIILWIMHTKDKICYPCVLELRKYKFAGMEFYAFLFNTDGSMRSFSHITKVPNSTAVLNLGGNINQDGTLKYSALLVVDGKLQEAIHYNPEMLISQRWGYRPDNSILYREDYTEGKLTRREWLKEVNTPVGPREVPDYTENF